MSGAARAAVVIFARHPELGRVKTRLVPPLTPNQALALHLACLRCTVALTATLPPGLDKLLCLTSPSLRAARRLARSLNLPSNFRVGLQSSGTLGRRLAGAFARLQAEGYSRVVVVGTDSPAMPALRLKQAFAALRRADAVLGPTLDGGYYLVGLRLPDKRLARLFRKIDWGTSRTFRQTKARMRASKLRVAILPVGYDVDVADDLERLRRDLRPRSPRLQPLRDWFAQWKKNRSATR